MRNRLLIKLFFVGLCIVCFYFSYFTFHFTVKLEKKWPTPVSKAVAERTISLPRPSVQSNIPILLAKSTDFHQNVTFFKLKSKQLYVFSAYGDQRFGKMVRFVGMAIHDNYRGLKCVIARGNELEFPPATVNYIPEGHSQKFVAVYVVCISKFPLTNQTMVGLSSHGNQSYFFLPLQTIPTSPRSSKKGLAVCYPPLHNNFDDVDMFVENIELNRILGFRKFFVYVHKVGARVRRAINSYVRDGVISVISWKEFPLASDSKYPVPKDYTIHYFGQMVAINDCLYRAMNQPFRVVAFHDFDEVIIPNLSRSLIDVVAKAMGPSVSGLSVRCAMFSTLYPDGTNSTSNSTKDQPRLLTQLKTTRIKQLFPHKNRSKMLVVAENVVTMGIHFVWEYHRHQAANLDASVALLHHYRVWKKTEGVVVRTALKYHLELLSNVKQRLYHL